MPRPKVLLSSLFLFAAAAAGGCSAPAGADAGDSTSALASDPPVRLRFADALQACSSCVSWIGAVEVENIAYQKDVTIVWRMPLSGGTWGPWQESKAQYFASAANNREIWSFANVGGLGEIQFAVRYRVNGQEFWDNNGGNNYDAEIVNAPNGLVTLGAPMGAGVDVAVTGAAISLGGPQLNADILVKNLAFQKDVTAVWTTDDWATTHTTAATYSYGDRAGGEHWVLNADFEFAGSVNKIQFAVLAHQNGRDAWDNNFTSNYSCNLDAKKGWSCSGADLVR